MTANPSALWFLNGRVEVLRASAEHPDGVSVMEIALPFGDSPPLHVHHRQDEVFHILEGEVRFRVGDQDIVGREGQTLVGPAGAPHSFRVLSPGGARMLVTTKGPDFEQTVRDFSRPAGEGLPEEAEVTPEIAQALGAVCARHHIDLLGPPLDA